MKIVTETDTNNLFDNNYDDPVRKGATVNRVKQIAYNTRPQLFGTLIHADWKNSIY